MIILLNIDYASYSISEHSFANISKDTGSKVLVTIRVFH